MSNNLLIVAGEPSGDALGGPLAEHILELHPNTNLWGYGGSKMSRAGVEILTHVSELSIMGFRDVVGRLPEMFRRMDNLAETAVERGADGAVLIDYPGFNIRLAERLAKRGIPVVYYVSPQIWAWKPGRIKKLAKSISRMLTILPFEEELYRAEGVPVTYVGHYFVDEVKPTTFPSKFREEHDLREPILLMLPGSRKQEVSRLLNVMIEAFKILKKRMPELILCIAGCLAQEMGVRLFERFPDLDLIMGPRDIGKFYEILDSLITGGKKVITTDTGSVPPDPVRCSGFF